MTTKEKKSKRAKGGLATFRKYGSKHMSMLAKKMHKKRKQNANNTRKTK